MAPGTPPLDIRIVAHGANIFQGSLNPELTYAAELHNPNVSWIAVGVTVDAVFLDHDGNRLMTVRTELTALPPGQFTAVGGTGPPNILGDRDSVDINKLARVRYLIGVGRWQPASMAIGAFRASDVHSATGDFGMQTSATLQSTFTETVSNVTFIAVYYDAAGKVIGGAYGCDDVDPGAGNYVETDRVSPIPNVQRTDVFVQWKPLL
jgi:hypothetical protein